MAHAYSVEVLREKFYDFVNQNGPGNFALVDMISMAFINTVVESKEFISQEEFLLKINNIYLANKQLKDEFLRL